MNAIPVLGWAISFCVNVSLAIPFWILWTACGLGVKFFFWLPPVYLGISFWNTVGLFIVLSILHNKLMPTISASATANENK